MKYPRVFHMLRVHGHNGQRAAEIILAAAVRKDAWALRWIRRAHAMTPIRQWIARRKTMS